MLLKDVSDYLRQTADRIEKLQDDLVLPKGQGQFSIPHAFAALRLECGKNIHICVRPPLIESYSVAHELRATEWEVYLGYEAGSAHGHHVGATLGEAVETAIRAYRAAKCPNVTSPTKAIEAITNDLSENPF